MLLPPVVISSEDWVREIDWVRPFSRLLYRWEQSVLSIPPISTAYLVATVHKHDEVRTYESEVSCHFL